MPGFTDKYKNDEKAVTEGKWFDLGDGVEVKVVRIDNADSRKMRMNLERPYRGRDIPVSRLEDILSTVVARAVLKDWKGVTDENGNELMFSSEEALRQFRRYPDFRDDVAVAAADREQFRVDTLEEDSGN
jgi:hypothetical protein